MGTFSNAPKAMGGGRSSVRPFDSQHGDESYDIATRNAPTRFSQFPPFYCILSSSFLTRGEINFLPPTTSYYGRRRSKTCRLSWKRFSSPLSVDGASVYQLIDSLSQPSSGEYLKSRFVSPKMTITVVSQKLSGLGEVFLLLTKPLGVWKLCSRHVVTHTILFGPLNVRLENNAQNILRVRLRFLQI